MMARLTTQQRLELELGLRRDVDTDMPDMPDMPTSAPPSLLSPNNGDVTISPVSPGGTKKIPPPTAPKPSRSPTVSPGVSPSQFRKDIGIQGFRPVQFNPSPAASSYNPLTEPDLPLPPPPIESLPPPPLDSISGFRINDDCALPPNNDDFFPPPPPPISDIIDIPASPSPPYMNNLNNNTGFSNNNSLRSESIQKERQPQPASFHGKMQEEKPVPLASILTHSLKGNEIKKPEDYPAPTTPTGINRGQSKSTSNNNIHNIPQSSPVLARNPGIQQSSSLITPKKENVPGPQSSPLQSQTHQPYVPSEKLRRPLLPGPTEPSRNANITDVPGMNDVRSQSPVVRNIKPPISPASSQRSSGSTQTEFTHEAEVDKLTDQLLKGLRATKDPNFYGMCAKCGEEVLGEASGCQAMDNIYHIKCFTCNVCTSQLKGKPFYAMEGKPFCEDCYLNTLEKCSVCSKPITDRILRATGKPYHPACFICVVCGKSLDGIPFTVDATNQIHCIEDFHKKFAPKCHVCGLGIMPEPGETETVRIVALDRSFHVACYKCEVTRHNVSVLSLPPPVSTRFRR